MTPGTYDLDLYRGDTYAWTFRLWADEAKTIPVDLTGAAVAAEIRDKTAGTTIVPLDVTISATPGEIDVALTGTEWALGPPAAAVWDLQVTFPGDVVQTVLAGKVTITGDVTDSTLTTAMIVAARGARRGVAPGALRSA